MTRKTNLDANGKEKRMPTPYEVEYFMRRHNITQITHMPAVRLGRMDMAESYAIVSGNGYYSASTIADCVGQIK